MAKCRENGIACLRKGKLALRRRNLKTNQSPVILDFCLRNTWSWESSGSPDANVFEKIRFKMLSVHTKMQGRRFQIPPVGRAFSKSSIFKFS